VGKIPLQVVLFLPGLACLSITFKPLIAGAARAFLSFVVLDTDSCHGYSCTNHAFLGRREGGGGWFLG